MGVKVSAVDGGDAVNFASSTVAEDFTTSSYTVKMMMYLMENLAFIYIEVEKVPLISSPSPSLVLLRNIKFLLQ